MASTSRLGLIDSALTATHTSDTKSLTNRADKLIAWQNVSANSGNVSTVIQHSPDGSNWVTLASFAAKNASATGVESIQITANVFPQIRAVSTLTATATIRCDLYFEDSK